MTEKSELEYYREKAHIISEESYQAPLIPFAEKQPSILHLVLGILSPEKSDGQTREQTFDVILFENGKTAAELTKLSLTQGEQVFRLGDTLAKALLAQFIEGDEE